MRGAEDFPVFANDKRNKYAAIYVTIISEIIFKKLEQNLCFLALDLQLCEKILAADPDLDASGTFWNGLWTGGQRGFQKSD